MLVVQKYGGSSVADLGRVRAVARRCLDRQRAGDDLLVVVSAMQGETNRLLGMANELIALGGTAIRQLSGPYVGVAKVGDAAYERELDQLASTGEQVSAALLAMAIQDLGGKAVSLVSHQLGMVTDRRFTNARITEISRERIDRELAAARVVVCAGFQGIDSQGDITTLGRGGSDTSAVALAAALQAGVCEILTDVDGVYTTDPRIVRGARKLARISYEEMIELASVGSKVLQIRAVEFAMKYNVPVHVRSSLNRNEGTLIVPEEQSMESVLVAGVALNRDEAKVTLVDVPDVPGVVAAIFGPLGQAGIVVDMIIQNASHDGRTDVTFTVPEGELERATGLLRQVEIEGHKCDIRTDPKICKVSIVGVGMRTHAGVAAQAFEALAAEAINVQMVSTSEIKVSCVVHQRYAELAVRCLHDAFGLDRGPEV